MSQQGELTEYTMAGSFPNDHGRVFTGYELTVKENVRAFPEHIFSKGSSIYKAGGG